MIPKIGINKTDFGPREVEFSMNSMLRDRIKDTAMAVKKFLEWFLSSLKSSDLKRLFMQKTVGTSTIIAIILIMSQVSTSQILIYENKFNGSGEHRRF